MAEQEAPCYKEAIHSSEDSKTDNTHNDMPLSFTEANENLHNLEERRVSLSNSMIALRNQILEEKALWRQEIDIILEYTKNNDCVCHLSQTNLNCNDSKNIFNQSAQVITNEAVISATPLTNQKTIYSNHFANVVVPIRDTPPQDASINEDIINEYERKISKYQEILAATQAENKSTLRKQLVANAFRRRLQEVENMCTVELLRVRQSISSLQPLQSMLNSDWPGYSDLELGDHAIEYPSRQKIQSHSGSSKAESLSDISQTTYSAQKDLSTKTSLSEISVQDDTDKSQSIFGLD